MEAKENPYTCRACGGTLKKKFDDFHQCACGFRAIITRKDYVMTETFVNRCWSRFSKIEKKTSGKTHKKSSKRLT